MFAWKSENQSWILCLFSILGHKFHNVLWVDLSCIEKNILSWAHLKNGGSWALWTLEVGEVEDHQVMAIDVFFDIHCEFRCILNLEKKLFMLRFLNKKQCNILKVHGWFILKLCIYSPFLMFVRLAIGSSELKFTLRIQVIQMKLMEKQAWHNP